MKLSNCKIKLNNQKNPLNFHLWVLCMNLHIRGFAETYENLTVLLHHQPRRCLTSIFLFLPSNIWQQNQNRNFIFLTSLIEMQDFWTQETIGFDLNVENQLDFFSARCKNINDDEFYSFIFGHLNLIAKIFWDWSLNFSWCILWCYKRSICMEIDTEMVSILC